MNLYFYSNLSDSDVVLVSLYINQNASAETITLKRAVSLSEIYNGGDGPVPEFATTHTSILGNTLYTLSTKEVVLNLPSLVTQYGSPSDYQTWAICNYVDYSLPDAAVRGIFLPTPLFRNTASSKTPGIEPALYMRQVCYSLNIPFMTSPYEDCFCIAVANDIILDGDPFTVTSFTGKSINDIVKKRIELMPHIALSTSGVLSSNSNATVTAQLVDSNGNNLTNNTELFFENVNGQISHNRKTTVNGIASILVAAPMMSQGDTVRIKVGSKFFSSINDITLTVQ